MKETILIILFLSLASAQYCKYSHFNIGYYGNDCYSGCCYNGMCESMTMCEEALDGFWIFFWVIIGIDIFVWFVYICLYFSKRKSTMLRIGVINEKARIAFERA